ncbi:MAG: cache domain-containing protein [Deltaproteobacteria bacterium]|nr:cache domain-containing protein [Candidatus Anaeroferrophillus wilburensis]MBN2889374.1 cache domain-containing protein [Deltaproteobacteria bacterium]
MLLPSRFKNAKLRTKMFFIVLPLVIIPMVLTGSIIGYFSARQARQGITCVSKDDLEHMVSFTRHLFEAHHRQFQVYQQERRERFIAELTSLARLASSMVAAEYQLYKKGSISLRTAHERAAKALKQISIGESGYVYAMSSDGQLQVHIVLEGENISEQQDGNGRYFISEMCQKAVQGQPDSVHYIRYPWRNPALGDIEFREKIAAYLYFPEWDWIIAATGYVAESYDDIAFEQRALADLKEKIKQKKVGRTGYIFCMNSQGTFTIHPEKEGENLIDVCDAGGKAFIKEMCNNKRGWIRYLWRNTEDAAARMKIVCYDYFEPWDWIVAVGSYEDEFYQPANMINRRSIQITMAVTMLASIISMLLVSYTSKVVTEPIRHMISVIQKIKTGRLEEKMEVSSSDELGELAQTFNKMTSIIKENQELEATLAQQDRMASLGVFSSGVAHEINNPLGIILGYAGYLEKKIDHNDENFKYIHEIKHESKRCREIVQNLLSYARPPQPALQETDIKKLLENIIDFAANHGDLHHISISSDIDPQLPAIMVDGDQLRQVAINLMLNAGAAMRPGGHLRVECCRDNQHLVIAFHDDGCGIPAVDREKIFEPFFTSKKKGTGLGLAISKRIIEQHHGTIDVDSSPGKGTTFTIRMPFEPKEFLL